MTEPISGSIEILTSGGDSIGVVGQRWTPDAVPIVLETLHGITQMAPMSPETQPTGRTPDAQWRGVDAQSQTVTVLFWREIPYDETAVAQAIAHVIAEGEGAQ